MLYKIGHRSLTNEDPTQGTLYGGRSPMSVVALRKEGYESLLPDQALTTQLIINY